MCVCVCVQSYYSFLYTASTFCPWILCPSETQFTVYRKNASVVKSYNKNCRKWAAEYLTWGKNSGTKTEKTFKVHYWTFLEIIVQQKLASTALFTGHVLELSATLPGLQLHLDSVELVQELLPTLWKVIWLLREAMTRGRRLQEKLQSVLVPRFLQLMCFKSDRCWFSF